MTLLLGTDIAKLVKQRIRGSVARAGGSVDQLVDYRALLVEDINIPDGGFGKLCKSNGCTGSINTIPFLRRVLRQEVLFLLQGHRVCRDRKTIVMDMHNACDSKELQYRYDCSISSNLLEHSPNPIWLLLNFYFITKKGGCQFHAIPHFRYTYDRFREPTAVEHFIEDFEKRADFSDTTHVDDYQQSAVVKDGWQKKFHEKYPLSYPFIHFHVFDEHNTRSLFEFMFEEVVNDVYRTDRFSDNVILFSNSLNKQFIDNYRDVINSYSPLILL